MKQSFTPNHLVKYLYHETTASENLAIDEAIAQDRVVADEYGQLLEAYQQLPKVKFNPSKSSIQQILGYSKRAALEEHA
jgi:hypothetical protein